MTVELCEVEDIPANGEARSRSSGALSMSITPRGLSGQR